MKRNKKERKKWEAESVRVGPRHERDATLPGKETASPDLWVSIGWVYLCLI